MPFISSIRKNYDVSDKTGTLEKFEITGGNSITTSGGYRIHTFSSVGEAELSIKLKNANAIDAIGLQTRKTLQVEYMVLAGGGCGGARHGSGGGGAGGYLTGITTVATGAIPVTVGAGAAGDFIAGPGGSPNGGSSNFDTVRTVGGGRGASYYDHSADEGGCGGGGCGHTGGGGGGIGGRGWDIRNYDLDRINQGGGVAGQGFRGGVGAGGYPNGYGGLGGPGISTPIAGGTRGGGGGGAAWNPGTPDKGGAGGVGGGGAGRGGEAYAPAGNGGDATGSNTGSGGGGGNANPTRGGNGSPGIVVVRYLT